MRRDLDDYYEEGRQQQRSRQEQAFLCAMRDALTTIQPEIHEFVSQENRSHADPWLQKTKWVPHERTLVLYVIVQAAPGER